MKPIPFAILSDSPDCPSGFARIARDLAWHIYKHMPQLRVATFGYWGTGSSRFPWPQYQLGDFRAEANLTPLPGVWQDFAQGQKGILFTIYDAARLLLLAKPDLILEEGRQQRDLKTFLRERPFQLWGYFPVDSHGPGGKLTGVLREVLLGYDRILAYGPYGSGVIGRTTDRTDIPWIPHGLYPDTFRPTEGGRDLLNLYPGTRLLGVVGTNQGRKDWGTTFQVLKALGKSWKLWAHVDKTIGIWSFPALAEDLGVADQLIVTQGLEDHQLAQLYTASAVTFANGLGEGFGYPIMESQFCGTPVIHVNYGGGPDLIKDKGCLVDAAEYRLDGAYPVYRPVLAAAMIAELCDLYADTHVTEDYSTYEWPVLWYRWKRWLQEGL